MSEAQDIPAILDHAAAAADSLQAARTALAALDAPTYRRLLAELPLLAEMNADAAALISSMTLAETTRRFLLITRPYND